MRIWGPDEDHLISIDPDYGLDDDEEKEYTREDYLDERADRAYDEGE